MSSDDNERRIVSRKELAKEQRREAYQKAKERRSTDPRHLALKEAAKVQRRATYQKLKQNRAADAAEKKGKASKLRSAELAQRVLASDAQRKRIVERCANGETLAHNTQRTVTAVASSLPAASAATAATAATAEQGEHDAELAAYVSWTKPSRVLN